MASETCLGHHTRSFLEDLSVCTGQPWSGWETAPQGVSSGEAHQDGPGASAGAPTLPAVGSLLGQGRWGPESHLPPRPNVSGFEPWGDSFSPPSPPER